MEGRTKINYCITWTESKDDEQEPKEEEKERKSMGRMGRALKGRKPL